MYRIAAWKLFFGLVTLFVPILLAACLIYLWSLVPDEMGGTARAVFQLDVHSATGSWFVDLLLVASSVSASLFIWSAAAGVNRKDEVSAGAVALAVIASWYLRGLRDLFTPYHHFHGERSIAPAVTERPPARVCSFNCSGWLLSGVYQVRRIIVTGLHCRCRSDHARGTNRVVHLAIRASCFAGKWFTAAGRTYVNHRRLAGPPPPVALHCDRLEAVP